MIPLLAKQIDPLTRSEQGALLRILAYYISASADRFKIISLIEQELPGFLDRFAG
ncbi:hypothetical protein D3C80_2014240 [compost metagenome]